MSIVFTEDEEMEPIMYQPKMDLNRFQRFLEAEERNNTLSTISGQAHLSHLDQGPVQSTRIQDTQSLQTTQATQGGEKGVRQSAGNNLMMIANIVILIELFLYIPHSKLFFGS